MISQSGGKRYLKINSRNSHGGGSVVPPPRKPRKTRRDRFHISRGNIKPRRKNKNKLIVLAPVGCPGITGGNEVGLIPYTQYQDKLQSKGSYITKK